MKKQFTVDGAQFRAAVAWVAKWVPSKPSVPVWAGILMEARDGKLSICAYDEDVTARAVVPYEGDAAGTVLVSGRLLNALVGTFPAKTGVVGEADDAVLTLTAGRVVVSLPLIGATDFPTLPVAPSTVAMMDGAVLADVVTRVSAAAAKDPAQGVWCAIRIEFTEGRIDVVASDSRRVSWAAAEVPGASDAVALVPAAVVADAVRLTATAAEVEIGISGNLASFTADGRTLTVRQAADKYRIEQIRKTLKIEPPAGALVRISDLLTAVKRAQILGSEKNPTVLDWEAELVSVSGADTGAKAAEPIPLEYDGEPGKLAVNPAYLADALAGVNGPVARLAFTVASNRPLVITDPDDECFRAVMVPIKLQS